MTAFVNTSKNSATYINESKVTSTLTNEVKATAIVYFEFLIDNTYSLLIDGTNKFLIGDGGIAGAVFTNQLKN